MIMLGLLEAGLGIEDDLESESELATDLSLNFTKGEELFFLALSRSKVRAMADLFAVGGGVDIFTFQTVLKFLQKYIFHLAGSLNERCLEIFIMSTGLIEI